MYLLLFLVMLFGPNGVRYVPIYMKTTPYYTLVTGADVPQDGRSLVRSILGKTRSMNVNEPLITNPECRN